MLFRGKEGDENCGDCTLVGVERKIVVEVFNLVGGIKVIGKLLCESFQNFSKQKRSW